MKHADASLQTKRAMAASLKRFMELKPLSKITVSEICADCNINRKTFYYHFEDIYGLLKWMLEQETVEIVKTLDVFSEDHEIINFVIDYVDKNNHILNCAYDAMGREGMKRFFFSDFEGVILVIIGGIEKQQKHTLDADFKQFLCTFYTNALSGMLIDWFHDKSIYSREEIIDYIILTIKSSLPSVITARTAKLTGKY